MKVTLVVNVKASSVTAQYRKHIVRAVGAQHELSVVETIRRGHATKLARTATDDGFDAVVVLGGDGTLNEAANGLAGSETALGVIPGGSTNVFARTIGMTNDPLYATVELLDAMEKDHRRRIGLGNANGRYFLFHVGIGFDAAVVEQVERRAELKRYAGHPFFILSTLATWARYGGRGGPRFSVQFPEDDDVHGDEPVNGFLTICLNSNPYTFLGNRPFNIAPDCTFEKGLAVMTVRSLRFPAFFGIIGSALRSGRYLRHHPQADFRSEVHSCEIHGYRKFPYQIDGDYLGDIEHLILRHEPEVLDVFLPLPPA